MPFEKSTVKTAVGMQTLDFWPITEEPDNKHPVYGNSVNLGAAVKGYLTITTASASIPGDDIVQVEDEVFTGAQFDTETTMSDLEVNSVLFGHTFSADAGEESKGTDRSKVGGISFIEPILLKNKTQIFRATCLFRTSAMASSEKQEADTKKPGELNPKMNAVSFKVMEDNMQSWRLRNDFATKAEAEAFIRKTFGTAG
jgi:hypothetical protein